jgi:hypothetical protein
MHRLEEKSSAPARNQSPVIQSIVRHYTKSATLADSKKYNSPIFDDVCCSSSNFFFQGTCGFMK